jgi:hypothetical protein
LTPTHTSTETPTLTATITPTLTSEPGDVFSNLDISTTVFYRLDATPTKVTFTININDPAGINFVEIYFRLRDPSTNETTEWANEHMSLQGDGAYTYTLSRAHPALTPSAPKTMILEYQFIVTHDDLTHTRSLVYNDVTLKSH